MSTIYRVNGIFQYAYHENGKRRKKSLHTKDRGCAKLIQAKYDLELSQQGAGLATDKDLQEYFAWYKATHYIGLKPLHAVKEIRILKRFVEGTKAEKLSHLTGPRILEWLSSQKKIGPKTWNNLRGIIKTFLDPAVPNHLRVNPVSTVPIKKTPSHGVDFYTDDEYRAIEKAADSNPLRVMIAIARYSGLRIAEIIHLHAEDISFGDKPLIYVRNRPELDHTVKNYQERAVPLCLELKSILAPFKAKYGLLFPKSSKIHPERALNEALTKVGVKRKGRAWHLLRHTFASRAVQNGVSLVQIMRWMGHGDYKTTLRYSHLSPSYSAEIEKINLEPATNSATA